MVLSLTTILRTSAEDDGGRRKEHGAASRTHGEYRVEVDTGGCRLRRWTAWAPSLNEVVG